jgi:hypothetical protein
MPYEVFTLKHNPDKIDPNYYKILLNQFRFNSKEVIYFEHDENAVKSAISIGIASFHYDKDKQDLIALKEFIDKSI